MDELLKVALLGTAKQAAALPDTHPATALGLHELSESPERSLLLAAGAAAVYHDAGAMPTAADAIPVADAETQAACSPQAAILIRHVFANATGLLPEVLNRMTQAGLCLPADLLPLALEKTPADQRARLVPVIGARGRWLAQFNPAWKTWVLTASVGAATDMPPDLETIWQEGKISERAAALERLRHSDPARGRDWLREVWNTEKADHRLTLLESLRTGLSADDEQFLDEALRDRSGKVSSLAADLLALLPESDLSARMRERAEAMLTFDAANARLTIVLPPEMPKEWTKDGLTAQPPYGVGKREHTLMQVQRLVSPAHWELRFEVEPAALIDAASHDDSESALLHGWSQAAIKFQLPQWQAALFDYWAAQTPKKRNTGYDHSRAILMDRLLRSLPFAAAEPRVLRLLENPELNDGHDWFHALLTLPVPWPASIGRAYIAQFRPLMGRLLDPKQERLWQWLESFPLAAAALPVNCFDEVLSLWQLPEGDQQDQYVRRQLEALQEVVRTRAALAEAIPIPK